MKQGSGSLNWIKLLNFVIPAPGSSIYERRARRATRVFAKISPAVAVLCSLLLVLVNGIFGIFMGFISLGILVKLFFIAWGVKKMDRDPSILYAFSFLVPVGIFFIHFVQMLIFDQFTKGW